MNRPAQVLMLLLLTIAAAAVDAADASPDKLLRLAYDSAATGKTRSFFLYLPAGYADPEQC